LAIQEAQEVVKRESRSFQGHLILGNAYFLKRNIPKAIQSFDGLIQIAPNNPIGYFQKGRVLLIQKKEKEALAQLEKTLSLQPNFLDALNLMVGVYINQKENKRGIERVKAQIKTSPQNPFFYNLLGRLHEVNGRSLMANS